MKQWRNFFMVMVTVFLLLCIFFIPFTFHFFPVQQQITDFLFGTIIRFSGEFFFGISLRNTDVFSDSVSMYILLLLFFIVSVVVTVILKFVFGRRFETRLTSFVYTICIFYLSLVLMKYGLDKVFKSQFYLPEPNTLYTPLGQLDKDILFWSSMGTSRLYNVITGSIEVLTAVLLFFRKTRLAGILLSLAVMLQIVIINFSFDISVKLFSSFLFLMALYLCWPYAERIVTVLFTTKRELPQMTPNGKTINSPVLKVFLKTLIAGLFLLESFYPYFRDKNFNDDKAARPLLHGAYTVVSVVENNDSLRKDAYPFKRFFIHRSGYLIFQLPDDRMQDYRLNYNMTNQLFLLEDYNKNKQVVNYHFNAKDSILELSYLSNKKRLVITGKAHNWKNLPLINDSFHWFSE